MKWAPQHDAMLLELHPEQGIFLRDIAALINERYGTNYTFRQVSERSAQLGLPKRGHTYAPKARASQWWISR